LCCIALVKGKLCYTALVEGNVSMLIIKGKLLFVALNLIKGKYSILFKGNYSMLY